MKESRMEKLGREILMVMSDVIYFHINNHTNKLKSIDKIMSLISKSLVKYPNCNNEDILCKFANINLSLILNSLGRGSKSQIRVLFESFFDIVIKAMQDLQSANIEQLKQQFHQQVSQNKFLIKLTFSMIIQNMLKEDINSSDCIDPLRIEAQLRHIITIFTLFLQKESSNPKKIPHILYFIEFCEFCEIELTKKKHLDKSQLAQLTKIIRDAQSSLFYDLIKPSLLERSDALSHNLVMKKISDSMLDLLRINEAPPAEDGKVAKSDFLNLCTRLSLHNLTLSLCAENSFHLTAQQKISSEIQAQLNDVFIEIAGVFAQVQDLFCGFFGIKRGAPSRYLNFKQFSDNHLQPDSAFYQAFRKILQGTSIRKVRLLSKNLSLMSIFAKKFGFYLIQLYVLQFQLLLCLSSREFKIVADHAKGQDGAAEADIYKGGPDMGFLCQAAANVRMGVLFLQIEKCYERLGEAVTVNLADFFCNSIHKLQIDNQLTIMKKSFKKSAVPFYKELREFALYLNASESIREKNLEGLMAHVQRIERKFYKQQNNIFHFILIARIVIKISSILKELGNAQEAIKYLEKVNLKYIISMMFDLAGGVNPVLSEQIIASQVRQLLYFNRNKDDISLHSISFSKQLDYSLKCAPANLTCAQFIQVLLDKQQFIGNKRLIPHILSRTLAELYQILKSNDFYSRLSFYEPIMVNYWQRALSYPELLRIQCYSSDLHNSVLQIFQIKEENEDKGLIDIILNRRKSLVKGTNLKNFIDALKKTLGKNSLLKNSKIYGAAIGYLLGYFSESLNKCSRNLNIYLMRNEISKGRAGPLAATAGISGKAPSLSPCSVVMELLQDKCHRDLAVLSSSFVDQHTINFLYAQSNINQRLLLIGNNLQSQNPQSVNLPEVLNYRELFKMCYMQQLEFDRFLAKSYLFNLKKLEQLTRSYVRQRPREALAQYESCTLISCSCKQMEQESSRTTLFCDNASQFLSNCGLIDFFYDMKLKLRGKKLVTRIKTRDESIESSIRKSMKRMSVKNQEIASEIDKSIKQLLKNSPVLITRQKRELMKQLNIQYPVVVLNMLDHNGEKAFSISKYCPFNKKYTHYQIDSRQTANELFEYLQESWDILQRNEKELKDSNAKRKSQVNAGEWWKQRNDFDKKFGNCIKKFQLSLNHHKVPPLHAHTATPHATTTQPRHTLAPHRHHGILLNPSLDSRSLPSAGPLRIACAVSGGGRALPSRSKC